MHTLSSAAMLLFLHFAASGSAHAGEIVQVKIVDLAFMPSTVTVHAGDTVEWVNQDLVDHTATAKNNDWDVVVIVGSTARFQAVQAGTTDYFCRFHPNMTGKIVVVSQKTD